jgi:DNA-directed RNA polymerase subunit N (RpoN/RPB10)
MEKIVSNKIRCKKCGDVIESKSEHDFRWCSCKNSAVDGGYDYLRRCYKSTSPQDAFEELSLIEVNGEVMDADAYYKEQKKNRNKDREQ